MNYKEIRQNKGKYKGMNMAEIAEVNPELVRSIAKMEGKFGDAARAFLTAQKEARAHRYAPCIGRKISTSTTGSHPTAMYTGDPGARASIQAEKHWDEDNDLDEQFWNRDA